ncbi:MAG: hypothetical protein ABSG21_14650 [Spirochaetia bacterium]|jgi:hypothetical protein
MKRSAFALALSSAFALLSLAAAYAQEPVSIAETSSSARILGNGSTEITFVAVLNLNVIPIAFNYHWERSDGAKTALRVISIKNPGEQKYRLVEKWTVGQNAQVNQLWEKVFVNSGNTHLATGPIMAGAVAESEAPAAAPAPAPAGAHPAYLHALSDLRVSRALLRGWTNPLIYMLVQQAVTEIEGALNDITEAAISDGKNIDDHPPIDASLANRNRLIRSLELLNKAYSDIDERETNPADMALRSKALGHISKARQDLNEARRIANWL